MMEPLWTLRTSSGALATVGAYRLDRVDDGVIAGASAHVARQRFADLRARQRLAVRYQLVCRQQKAGRTEAALRRVAVDEFLLQLRELATFGQAFDGLHRFSGN